MSKKKSNVASNNNNVVSHKIDVSLEEDSRSLDRPAWTSTDLHAYKHKHCLSRGKSVVKHNYYNR